MNLDDVREFMALARQAELIFMSEASWETKYDLIFGLRMQDVIDLKWYDPDTSLQEDVTAFMEAVREKMDEFYKIQAALDNQELPRPIGGYVMAWHESFARPSVMAAVGQESGDRVDDIFGLAQRIYATGWNVMITHGEDGPILYYDNGRFQQR